MFPQFRTAWTAALLCGVVIAVAWAGPHRVIDPALLERIHADFGQASIRRLVAWQKMIDASANLNENSKLRSVNRFFNGLPSIRDIDHWGDENYWATPYELLATNGGDCEDFAVAKYFTLKALGADDSKLRITYVRAYERGKNGLSITPHMVLAYFPSPEAEPLILDNLMNEILPASRRKDLVPTYSFNAEGLWSAKERGRGRLLGDTGRLRDWQDLLERMGETMKE